MYICVDILFEEGKNKTGSIKYRCVLKFKPRCKKNITRKFYNVVQIMGVKAQPYYLK